MSTELAWLYRCTLAELNDTEYVQPWLLSGSVLAGGFAGVRVSERRILGSIDSLTGCLLHDSLNNA